jgi:DNA-binding CsgD family transcriptional regulator/tetratricopeptide (TPR) repeat protein
MAATIGAMAQELSRGRDAFDREAWAAAYEHLSAAAATDPLDVPDLERLAAAAYLVGRRSESHDAWTKAHQDCARRGEAARAARGGFWLAVSHLNSGETGQGSGWIDRARRLLDQHNLDCVEQGYLRFAAALRSTFSGDLEAGYAGFSAAAEIGERFADPELVAQGRVGQGRCLIYLGRNAEGVGLLDEAMVAVGAKEVSPVATGDVYCTAIEGYQELFDVARVREWTDALSRWCESQPELVLYRGQCLLHRAELLVLQGAWADAVVEAQKACDRLAKPHHPALGAATYLRAELHRLSGEVEEADAAYRVADELGRDPQPGLALLRLVQGHGDAADAAIRRVWAQAGDPLSRARIVAAYVEILLTGGAVAEARAAVDSLAALPADLHGPYLRALTAQVTGAVLLAEGDLPAALPALRSAVAGWRDLGAPYEVARTRLLMAMACRELGDAEGAALEAESARAVFAGLGALPDVSRADALLAPGRPQGHPGGLTDREVEVIVLVAAGKTNRDIARELGISEKTVASHLSHMFTKLSLPSRAAATAFAYEHGLVK